MKKKHMILEFFVSLFPVTQTNKIELFAFYTLKCHSLTSKTYRKRNGKITPTAKGNQPQVTSNTEAPLTTARNFGTTKHQL